MNKFLTTMIAAIFAAVSFSAVAADTTTTDTPKAQSKKSDKPAKKSKKKAKKAPRPSNLTRGQEKAEVRSSAFLFQVTDSIYHLTTDDSRKRLPVNPAFFRHVIDQGHITAT
jgi:hypothetical protein